MWNNRTKDSEPSCQLPASAPGPAGRTVPGPGIASMGNSAVLQCMNGGVIQRAGLGVSVIPVDMSVLTSNQVKVNTINFGERYDTGLKKIAVPKKKYDAALVASADEIVKKFSKMSDTERASYNPTMSQEVYRLVWDKLTPGLRSYMNEPEQLTQVNTKSKTQGDHTIADAFIKKFQKDYVKGCLVSKVLDFYENLGNEIKYDNAMAAADDERIMDSNTKITNSLNLISGSKEKELNVFGWNVLIKEIIKKYNMGYAKSLLATQGVGSGGKGEAKGMENLGFMKDNPPDSVRGNIYRKEAVLASLFDVQSALKLKNHVKTGYPSIAGLPADEASGYMEKAEQSMADYKGPEGILTKSGKTMLDSFNASKGELMAIPVTSRFLTMAGWYVQNGNAWEKQQRKEYKDVVLHVDVPYELWDRISSFATIFSDLENFKAKSSALATIEEEAAGGGFDLDSLVDDMLEIQNKIIRLTEPLKTINYQDEDLMQSINILTEMLPGMVKLNSTLENLRSQQETVMLERAQYEGEVNSVEVDQLFEQSDEFIASTSLELARIIVENKDSFDNVANLVGVIRARMTALFQAIKASSPPA